MIKSARQIIREVLLGTNQTVDDLTSLGTEYQDVVMSYIDDAQDAVCDELLIANPYLLSTYFDLTLDGSERYYLPDQIPFNYESIIMVSEISSGTGSPLDTVVTVWGDRIYYFGDTTVSSRIKWSIRDQYIEFPNKPASGTMRVWYTRRVAGLFYGSASETGATTKVTLQTATVGQLVQENDYYNGMYIMHDTQARRITDYVIDGTDRDFTVSPAWTTAPAKDDVIDLVSPLPRAYQKRIVREAQIAFRSVNDDPIGELVKLSEIEGSHMKRRIRQQQRQGPEFVRRVP